DAGLVEVPRSPWIGGDDSRQPVVREADEVFAAPPDVARGSTSFDHRPATGGVPWVWKDSIVFSPHACPFLRSSSVHTIGFQSGARMRRAPALATSTRLPPGS